ncbi:MAG: amidohydrolase [Candidatus Glassbacteria bacterium]|nr:amidohydrolase [Candidatus Glassbacteria bacterium]
MARYRFLILVLLPFAALFACASPPEPADLVLTGGTVFTADSARTLAEAVAVRGNRIAAVGDADDIAAYIGPGRTRVIELDGAFVTPGFNDAHAHLLGVGEAMESLDLAGVTSWDVICQLVAERVGQAEQGELVKGMRWDQTLVGDGDQWPTKDLIDPVSPDNPVILRRVDGHSVLVNSYALREAKITSATPDPEGGAIVRDKSGEPTGVLKENAMGLLGAEIYGARNDPAVQERRVALALRRAAEVGVTSITEIGGDPKVLEKLAREHRLTARISYSPSLTDEISTLIRYEALRAAWEQYPTLRFGFLKNFMDGTLGSATAALFRPFNDNPSTSGVLVQTVEELTRKVLIADRRGFQIGIHAIGTRANRLVLDIYQQAIVENGRRDSRHRIEHSQILTEMDIPRFSSLGVIASMQPTHCITDRSYAESRLGKARCRYAYAWRSLLDAGAVVAFGSDAPVEALDPLEGLYAAVSRKDRAGEDGPGWIPQEKISMAEAIKLYTTVPAYAEFQECEKGMLVPGMLADLAVFDRNLLEAGEREIMSSRVLYTVFDGEIIYENTY